MDSPANHELKWPEDFSVIVDAREFPLRELTEIMRHCESPLIANRPRHWALRFKKIGAHFGVPGYAPLIPPEDYTGMVQCRTGIELRDHGKPVCKHSPLGVAHFGHTPLSKVFYLYAVGDIDIEEAADTLHVPIPLFLKCFINSGWPVPDRGFR